MAINWHNVKLFIAMFIFGLVGNYFAGKIGMVIVWCIVMAIEIISSGAFKKKEE